MLAADGDDDTRLVPSTSVNLAEAARQAMQDTGSTNRSSASDSSTSVDIVDSKLVDGLLAAPKPERRGIFRLPGRKSRQQSPVRSQSVPPEMNLPLAALPGSARSSFDVVRDVVRDAAKPRGPPYRRHREYEDEKCIIH